MLNITAEVNEPSIIIFKRRSLILGNANKTSKTNERIIRKRYKYKFFLEGGYFLRGGFIIRQSFTEDF